MKVLVTRPAEDGAEIAGKLAAMGHEALLTPLMTVVFHRGAPLALEGVQAILATSANGVRALAARTDRRDLPLFAVGPQTAVVAEDAGFVCVRNAAGDATALAARTGEWADPAKGALLHAAGDDAPGILVETLAARGFAMRRENLYRIIAVPELPQEAARALSDKILDAALFFSPRSAEIFSLCVQRAGLTTKGVIAVCISRNTAKALEKMDLSEIRIAAAPNQEAVLACL